MDRPSQDSSRRGLDPGAHALSAGIAVCLGLAALSASSLHHVALLRMGALEALSLVLLFLVWLRGERQAWTRYLVALAVAGFVRLSRVGAAADSSLADAGFWILHVVVLASFAWFFLHTLSRPADPDAANGEWTAMDLWLMNLALFAFAAVWALTVLRHGFAASAILAGFRGGLAVLSLGVLFVAAAKQARSLRGERLATLSLVCALFIALVLGGIRFARTERALRRGERALAEKRAAPAHDAARQASAWNQRLGWPPFKLRAAQLHRDAYAAEKRYGEALREMSNYLLARRGSQLVRTSYTKRGYAAQPELFDIFERYLRPAPLAPLLERYNDAQQAAFFRDIHSGSPRDLADDALLLLLFLRNGRLDRLAERYATGGFPETAACAGYEETLQAFARDHPDQAADGGFFLGIARFRAGHYPAALQAFEEALRARPQYHNAVAYGRRLGAIQGFANLPDALTTLSTRIPAEAMQGNRRWAPSIDDTLWTAFEYNPGTYTVSLEVRGQPARGEWPKLSVYLGDAEQPVLAQTIGSSQWTRVSFTRAYSSEGCERLLLVFENDFYGTGPHGAIENRNLEFRQALIDFAPQARPRN